MAFINWIQWTEDVVAMNHATLSDVTNRPLRDYLNAISIDPDGDITPPTTGVVNENILYVGKHGNDSNNGRNLAAAFLTFGAATAVVPSGFTIICLDSGKYIELVSIPDGVNLFAPNATVSAPIGSGTVALNIANTFPSQNGITAAYCVIGAVSHVGDQPSKNIALKVGLSDYIRVVVGMAIVTGANVTCIDAGGYSSINVGKLFLKGAKESSIGIDCKSTIDLQIASLNMSSIVTTVPGPIGVLLQSCRVSGHIGEIINNVGSSAFPSKGISSVNAFGTTTLTVDVIRSLTNPSSTLFDAIDVSLGELNVQVGRLFSTGNAYKLSAGTLRLFTMSRSGTTSFTGGTLVAKQLSDIP